MVELNGAPKSTKPDQVAPCAVKLCLGRNTQLLSSPARWDASDWGTAGLLGAAIAGTATFDRNIHNWSQDHRTQGRDHFFKTEQRFGAKWSFAVTVGDCALAILCSQRQ